MRYRSERIMYTWPKFWVFPQHALNETPTGKRKERETKESYTLNKDHHDIYIHDKDDDQII